MLSFAQRLVVWQRLHGRHNLPWQGQDAYRVWLSEIMLQQTQVATVIPYYQRFVVSFPNIAALAAATEDKVLAHWSGLGYYARGRNLHKAAQIIVGKYHGEFPREFEQIMELPGIGRSTAAAICALAYHERRAILDGNVKRVLARYSGIAGWMEDKRIEEQLWKQAETLLPTATPCPLPEGKGAIAGEGENVELSADIATYTQALMDMGATVCMRSNPRCVLCPVQADCVALQSERIAELPSPRPRKAVPERQATFLLLMHGNDILLEKRPGSGVWGGLWCPPQFEDEIDARDWFLLNGMEAIEGKRLETLTHTFTHFKLQITPLKIQLARKPLRVEQTGRVWLEVGEALGGAIPTPVRSLLQELTRA
jgi:A/G-specific adenine glycosylase